MMHQESLLSYGEDRNFKLLELPYHNNIFSMYVVLPKQNISSQKILSKLTPEIFYRLKSDAFCHNVDVLFPKFEVNSCNDIEEILISMGVKHAFDEEKADFDRMIVKTLTAYRVYINKIRQKAWIKVDEKGTEAAVATTSMHFSIGCAAAPRMCPSALFHANHPFVYFIVHKKSQSILFAGWMNNPEDKDS